MFTRTVLSTALLASTVLLGLAGAPRADEVTTTTTTSKTQQPDVVIGVPGVVGVEVGKPDCSKKNVTTSNGEGDTTSKTTTNCN